MSKLHEKEEATKAVQVRTKEDEEKKREQRKRSINPECLLN